MSDETQTQAIVYPTQAATRLGITVPDLVAMIRRNRYRFTEVKPGGKPGDRGRNRWGLTEAQLDAIVRGQERKWVEPKPLDPAPAYNNESPDGRTRIPANRRTRMRPH